jgi:YebC/PmpR family DNA-binding regulatory protein
MAGHSKFKNIQFRKGAQDKKRGTLFAKISKEITVAAKLGSPDPDTNARLRSAIQSAKAASFPKENIDRAIKKSTDKNLENYEQVRYEGFGPAGTAIIVEGLTDNRNRTASNVRTLFNKSGGALGETGSVSHLFNHYGYVKYNKTVSSEDDFFSFSIEAGAEDCYFEEDVFEAVCEPNHLSLFYTSMEKKFGEPESSGFQWKSQNLINVGGEKAKSLFNLLDDLENDEDVQQVFSNFEVSEDEIEKLL